MQLRKSFDRLDVRFSLDKVSKFPAVHVIYVIQYAMASLSLSVHLSCCLTLSFSVSLSLSSKLANKVVAARSTGRVGSALWDYSMTFHGNTYLVFVSASGTR